MGVTNADRHEDMEFRAEDSGQDRIWCDYCQDTKVYRGTRQERNDRWADHQESHAEERQRRVAEMMRDERLNPLTH